MSGYKGQGKKYKCEKKKGFEEKQRAQDHKTWLVKARGAILGKLEVYKCRYCSLFHVGHKPGSRSKR